MLSFVVGVRGRGMAWLLALTTLIGLGNVQLMAAGELGDAMVHSAPMIVSDRAPTTEARPTVASLRYGFEPG